jgi:hypothetical protein
MQSKATTVQAYLESLPEDRRAAIEAVRAVILKNLDSNIQEQMQYGMIGYAVPHSVFPNGYHCDPKQPLPYAGLASQKQHMSLYLMAAYSVDGHENDHGVWFRKAWMATGKKLDMGKACVRFKKLDDVPLEVVGEMFRRVPASAYIERYEAALAMVRPAKASKPSATKAGGTPAKRAAKNTAKAPAKTAATKTAKKTSKKTGTKVGTKAAAKKRSAKSARR